VAVLARDKPTFEFFETLECDDEFGFVQVQRKAHKRRSFSDGGPRLEGGIPRRGQRLREDRPVEIG
jgi:hypothetical protein